MSSCTGSSAWHLLGLTSALHHARACSCGMGMLHIHPEVSLGPRLGTLPVTMTACMPALPPSSACQQLLTHDCVLSCSQPCTACQQPACIRCTCHSAQGWYAARDHQPSACQPGASLRCAAVDTHLRICQRRRTPCETSTASITQAWQMAHGLHISSHHTAPQQSIAWHSMEQHTVTTAWMCIAVPWQ